jgi:ribose-phosphate pyrophosphokinase
MLKAPIKFFAGRESRYIGEQIANKFGVELGKSSVTVFSDGEFQPSFEEPFAGACFSYSKHLSTGR